MCSQSKPSTCAGNQVTSEDVAMHEPKHEAPVSDLESQSFVEDDLAKPLLPVLEPSPDKGWRHKSYPSLGDAHSSVPVPAKSSSFWKNMMAFSGVGLLISVGYMDPGNWATDLAGGSLFGYTLLSVVLLSNFLAMFLQYLALKLGVAGERDLAQACHDAYPVALNYFLWLASEVAITACDLAEVVGAAIALNLLFNLPLWAGVLITGCDVLLLIAFEAKNFRVLEVFVLILTCIIGGCFVYEIHASKPVWSDVLWGFVPQPSIITNKDQLYIAIGILGATVMPHNLFLHSSVIQTRAYVRNSTGKAQAIWYGSIDSTVSLFLAFFINAAILILSASAFRFADPPEAVTDIGEAYRLLSPTLGARAASILFGVSLLASGQTSTVTGTLAGQVVMEGFVSLKMPAWQRRLLTRLLAIVPAVCVAIFFGQQGVNEMLVVSQVILSMTLTFAMVPLVHFTSSKRYLQEFANSWFTTVCAVVLVVLVAALNIVLVGLVFAGYD